MEFSKLFNMHRITSSLLIVSKFYARFAKWFIVGCVFLIGLWAIKVHFNSTNYNHLLGRQPEAPTEEVRSILYNFHLFPIGAQK